VLDAPPPEPPVEPAVHVAPLPPPVEVMELKTEFDPLLKLPPPLLKQLLMVHSIP
jgi:hypothetical protein